MFCDLPRTYDVCITVFLLQSSIPLCVYTTICLYIHLLKFIFCGEGNYWEGGIRSDKMCHILIGVMGYVFVRVLQTIKVSEFPCMQIIPQ